MVSRKTRLMSAFLAILMVASMCTAFVLPAVAETTYSSVQTVTAAVSSGDYSVANEEDWAYLYANHATLFNSRDITIHLENDIDLSKVSGFTGFKNSLFSLDGHGKIIKNWKPSGAVEGLFSITANNMGMNFVQNFTLQGCEVTLNGNDALVLGGLSTSNGGFTGLPASVTVQGVTVTGCKVTASGQANGILVGRMANGATTAVELNIKNCRLLNNQMTATDVHNGLVIGKINRQKGSVTVNIEDVYLSKNSLTRTGGNGASGIVLGTWELDATPSGALNISNMGIFDNTLTLPSGQEPALLGQFPPTAQSSNIVGSIKNIISNGNVYVGGSAYLHNANAKTTDNYTKSNIFTGELATNNTKCNTKVTEQQLFGGETPYTINEALTNPSFYWTLSEDDKGNAIIVPGTEANRVRKVTIQREGAENVFLYANGGSEVYLPYGEITGVTGEGAALNDQMLTVGTADVTVNVPASALVDPDDYTTFPAPAGVVAYPDAPGYLVSTLADLEDVQKNVASFTTAHTIHLGADITVTEGSVANNMTGLKASIDGHGKAIKNVKFAGTGKNSGGVGDAWLSNYTGASIQNLTLEGWEATNLGWGGGMLISYCTTALAIKNVTVKKCYAASANNGYHSFLVGNKGSGDLTMENIRVEGSEFILATGLDNAGMILGRFWSDGILKIENVYAIGNTITGPGLQSAAAVGGLTGELQLSQAATISNVALLNTTYKNEPHLSGLVVGRVKEGDVTLSNVIAATDGYENLPMVYRQEQANEDAYPGTVTFNNVYTDAAYMQKGYGIETPVAGNATAEQVTGGWAAYQLNAANVEQKWMMKNGYPAFSEDGVTMKQFTITKEQQDATYADEYAYYNPGDRVELTLDAYNLLTEGTTVTGYTYEDKKLSFTMPEADVAAKFELTGADFGAIEEIKDKYASYDGKFELFTDGDDMKAAYDKAVEALTNKDTYNKGEGLAIWGEVIALDEKVTEIKLVDTFTSVEDYNAPLGRDYALFKDFNPVNWIVAEDDDWTELTKVNSNFAGKQIHIVKDINMNNAPVAPLGGYNKAYPFAGTLDGHGKVFQKFAINYTPEAGKDIYVGLVGALSGGTIQNVGIESGLIKVSGASTGKEAMVSGIVGGVTGKNSKIIHCWNGAEVNSVGYAGGDSTSGIARVEGDNNGVINGCYNIGKIVAGTNGCGISGAAHRNFIYNSFSTGDLTGSTVGLSRWTKDRCDEYDFNNYMATDSSNQFVCTAKCEYCQGRVAQYVLSADAYTTGELAAALNANMDKTTGIETYYTLDGGKIIFGTEENQTRKVTFKADGVNDVVAYYNAGTAVPLNYANGINVGGYTVNGAPATELTMGKEDIVVNVTMTGVNLAALIAAVDQYDSIDPAYFVTAEGTSLKTLIDQAEGYISDQTGLTQDDVNALTDKLNGEMSYDVYPNLPKASEYETYPDAVNLLVADIDDLNYVAKNTGKFTADKVLHFVENGTITVGAEDAANSLAGINSPIDGHGVTIEGVTHVGKNENADYAQDGWLGSFAGAYVKNLTMKNWTGTNMSKAAGLLIGEVEAANLLVENIKVTGCTVSASESNRLGISLLVGAVTKNYRSVAFKNITVENSTMNRGAAGGNSGILLGRAWWDNGSADSSNGGTLTVENVYLNNNTINGNIGASLGAGILLGEMTEKNITITDVGIFNTKFGEDAAVSGVLVGNFKNGAKLTATNILVGNNGEVATLIHQTANDSNYTLTTAVSVVPSNVYTDTANVVDGTSPITSNYTTADIMDGKAVYELNKVEGAQTWAIVDGVPAMATTGLPLAITYAIADVDYEVAMNGEDVTLYTDSKGNLIGMTAQLKADLEAAAFWGSDVQWEGTFEEATTFTGQPYPAHTAEHETSLVPDVSGNTHTIVCNHKEGDAICKYTETAGCTFEEIICVDQNALPENAQHQGECACGNREAAVNCNTGDETQWIRTEDEATVDKEGFIKHECKVCGYTHTERLRKLTAILVDAPDAYAGEQVEIEIGLQSNPGIAGEVITVTYDPSVMSFDRVQMDAPASPQVAVQYHVAKDSDGNEVGTVKISPLHNQNYTGEALVTVVFNVLEGIQEGAYDLGVSISASDFEGTLVQIKDYAGTIKLYNYIRGDASNDKKVSIADAVLLLRHVNDDPNLTIEVNEKAADVDNDGDITITDVIKLLQFLNGSIDTLEPTA